MKNEALKQVLAKVVEIMGANDERTLSSMAKAVGCPATPAWADFDVRQHAVGLQFRCSPCHGLTTEARIEMGDRFGVFGVHVEISWPGTGSMNAGEALARLSQHMDVSQRAARAEMVLNGFFARVDRGVAMELFRELYEEQRAIVATIQAAAANRA
jgi:hypothetical protein